jgi:hypothetical protein
MQSAPARFAARIVSNAVSKLLLWFAESSAMIKTPGLLIESSNEPIFIFL